MYTRGLAITEAQTQLKDTTATTKSLLSRALNVALNKFYSARDREYTDEERTFTVTAGQARYQIFERAMRTAEITINDGGQTVPLTRIDDKEQWLQMKANGGTGKPEFFYLVAPDMFELYPTPSETYANGGTLWAQARPRMLSQDDYTTGTVSLTNGSNTVTGVGTTFVAGMVGQSLAIESVTGESVFYKIIAVNSTIELELEQKFDGEDETGVDFRIGEYLPLPPEYHEGIVDYMLARGYLRRKDKDMASLHRSFYAETLAMAKRDYDGLDDSAVIHSSRHTGVGRKFSALHRKPEVV